jgi:hypothetical protein
MTKVRRAAMDDQRLAIAAASAAQKMHSGVTMLASVTYARRQGV